MNELGSRDWEARVWAVLAVAVVFGVLALLAAIAGSVGRFYGMMTGGSSGWAILLMAIPAVILVGLLLVILASLREPANVVARPGYEYVTALETLDRRYVRGELARDDYLRIRADLNRRSSQP